MSKKLASVFLLGCLLSLGAYETGPEIIKNGAFAKPCWHPGVPHWWEKLKPNTRGGEVEVKMENKGVLMYFTGPDYVDQIRLKQSVKLEPGNVYEFQYEYRSDNDISLKADACMIGTGVFLRAWWQLPAKNWTKVRGLFYLPPTVPEKGNVIVMVQNRSRVKLWYDNVSLKKTDLKKDEIRKQIPELKVHSVSTEDVFILPGTKRQSANFILNDMPDDVLKNFRVEAEYFSSNTKSIKCAVNGKKIQVPMNVIPVGKSTLVTKLFSKKDNALVGAKTVTLERVGSIPSNIDFSKHTPVVAPDGKKIFPIGIYAGVSWHFSVDDLKKKGFNVIFTYGSSAYSVINGKLDVKAEYKKHNLKMLKDAERLGVWVLMALPWQIADDADKNGKLPEWMSIYQNFPALFGYYVDEMRSIRNTPYPTIQKAYNTVKKADPKHPWYSYENPDPNLKNAMDSIILGVTGSNTIKACKFNLGQNKPILHCYGQIDFQNSIASSLEYNQYNCVMPVIWGARGLFYFIIDNLRDPKINPQCKELATRVYSTIERFSKAAPAVVSDDVLPEWTSGIKSSGKMEHAVFALKNTVYLFCGVSSESDSGGSIVFDVPEKTKLRDVLNDRVLTVGNKFTLKLNPGQARIIEIAK